MVWGMYLLFQMSVPYSFKMILEITFSYLELFNGIYFVLFYTQVGLFSRLRAISYFFFFILFSFICLFFKKKTLKMTFDGSPQSARVKGMMRNRAQLGPLGSQSGWGSQVVFCSPVSCFQRTWDPKERKEVPVSGRVRRQWRDDLDLNGGQGFSSLEKTEHWREWAAHAGELGKFLIWGLGKQHRNFGLSDRTSRVNHGRGWRGRRKQIVEHVICQTCLG